MVFLNYNLGFLSKRSYISVAAFEISSTNSAFGISLRDVMVKKSLSDERS